MSTNNTVNGLATTEKTAKVFNGEQLATITAHLKGLHSLCWDAGKGENVNPDFSALSSDELGKVCVRAINAITIAEKRVKDAKEAKVREAVMSVLEVYFTKARTEKAEYDLLSEALRARLGAFPNTVQVPVEELQGVLESSNPTVMVKRLFDLNICKIDARSVAKVKNVKHIAIPLPESK